MQAAREAPWEPPPPAPSAPPLPPAALPPAARSEPRDSPDLALLMVSSAASLSCQSKQKTANPTNQSLTDNYRN
jgi:hypothetical protein